MREARHNESQSTEPPISDQTQLNNIWRKCEIVIEEASSHAAYYREQGAALLKWSITTCLTINAGGLVATMNASSFDPRSRLWSGVWFLFGTLVALLVSAILALAFLRVARIHSEVAKDAKVALRTNDPQIIMAIDTSQIEKGEMLGGIGFFLSILSVVAFVVGALIMVEGSP